MRKTTYLFATVLLLVSIAGCAKAPQADIDAAKSSLESARAAQANEYAPASLRAAEDAQQQLEAELKAQEDKFAAFRSYKRSSELAAAAREAADKAAEDAKAGREQKRTDAQNAIAEARTMLDETRQMLETAPTGKGTQADIAAMKGDLDGAQSTLAEADNAFSADRYTEAMAKAESAKTSIQNVKTSIEQAKMAKTGQPRS